MHIICMCVQVCSLTHHQMVTGIALYCINLTLWNLTCFVCSVSQWPLNEYIDVIACELSLLKSFIYYVLLCAHSGETQYNRDKLLQGKCMYKLTSNVCCWPSSVWMKVFFSPLWRSGHRHTAVRHGTSAGSGRRTVPQRSAFHQCLRQ